MVDFDEYADDEYLDPQERELRYQRNKTAMEAFERDQMRFQQEKLMKQQQQRQQKIQEEVLKETGLAREEAEQFLRDNPEVAEKLYRENLLRNAQTIKRARDPKTGRFLPGKAKAETAPQSDDMFSPTYASVPGRGPRTYKKPVPTWEETKQKLKDPKRRTGTDQEVSEMFKSFIGDDPAFKI